MSQKWVMKGSVLCVMGIFLISSVLIIARSNMAAHAATTITLSSQDALNYPWLGFGAQYGNIQTSLTDSQWNTLFARVDYMNPGLMRTTDNFGMCTASGCPSYDWNAPSMQSWYRMLDHLKGTSTTLVIGTWQVPNGVDFTSTQFAQVQADFLNYMINTKGYTNIKYYHTPNEIDCNFNGQGEYTLSGWETAVNNLYTALRNDNLLGKVAIVGPDTCLDNWNGAAASDEQAHLGAYEWHRYDSGSSISSDNEESALSNQRQTIDANDPSNKPIFLGEMGIGNPDVPGVTDTYAYGLGMADYGIQLARAGLSGSSAWCLDNNLFVASSGTKQCGLGDVVAGTLNPWFYSWSLLTRYFRPGSVIYAPAVNTSGLRVVAARTTASSSAWTLAFVNQNSSDEALSVAIPGTGSAKFNQYNYIDGQRSVDSNGFPVPVTTINATLGSGVNVTVPANSMVLLTTLGAGGSVSAATSTPTSTPTSMATSTPTSTPTSMATSTPTSTPTSMAASTPTSTPTSMAASTPTSTATSTSSTIVDNLNDWSMTYSHTDGLVFDTIHDSWFAGDTSRVKRYSSVPQNFVYHYQNISNFQAQVYLDSPNSANSFSVDTSPDGTNWTPLALQNTVPITKVFDASTDTSGTTDISDIYTTIYGPANAVPSGTQYIRIDLANDPIMWMPQVGSVTLSYGTASAS